MTPAATRTRRRANEPVGVPVEDDPEMVAAGEKDLVRAAANPALGTVLSRVTGVLRWGAMAYALGRTGLADAYGIANNTPNIIYELVVGGVLSSTLVPLFVNTRRRTRRGEFDDGASAIITVSSLALLVLSVVGVLAAPWVAKAYTLGLEPGARAAQLELTVPLMRLFLPQIFLYGIVSLATAVLHSQHKLSIPAYTPIANNLVVTVMFVAARPLVQRVSEGSGSLNALLLVLGIGTTLGVVAQALPLIPPMRDGVVRLRWNLAPTHPVVKRLIRLSGWTMGYVVANQVSLYVVTNLANSGPEGTVATYQYAFAFFQLPHGLIAVSLMTAVLPRLATSFVDGDLTSYRANFREGLNVLFTVVLAAAAGYVVVAQLLIQVVFQRGAFNVGHRRDRPHPHRLRRRVAGVLHLPVRHSGVSRPPEHPHPVLDQRGRKRAQHRAGGAAHHPHRLRAGGCVQRGVSHRCGHQRAGAQLPGAGPARPQSVHHDGQGDRGRCGHRGRRPDPHAATVVGAGLGARSADPARGVWGGRVRPGGRPAAHRGPGPLRVGASAQDRAVRTECRRAVAGADHPFNPWSLG